MAISNLHHCIPMYCHLCSIKKKGKVKINHLLELFDIDDKQKLWNDLHSNRLMKIAYQKRMIIIDNDYFVLSDAGELFIRNIRNDLTLLLQNTNFGN